MELTEEQMRHAHFARCVDMDPRYKDMPPADRALAWAQEMELCHPPTIIAEYQDGKEILEKYTLSYSQRFVAGCARPSVPDNCGTILVDAGHIATSEARRIAYFRVR